MTQTEALKIARTALGVQLDALLGKAGHLQNDDRRRYAENGIKAIDEALAQPEQEPVAVYGYCPECGAKGVMRERRLNGNDICAIGHTYPSREAATSPQRKPLTKSQVLDLWEQTYVQRGSTGIEFARAIEAAHGIKGDA